jgi:hypothetical protein
LSNKARENLRDFAPNGMMGFWNIGMMGFGKMA